MVAAKEKEAQLDSELVQYAKMGGSLFPVGPTVPRLVAGFYNMQRSMFGWGVSPANPVSDDLIDIPGTPADDVMDDIAMFLKTKDRYMKTGLTHKRGYLFYGPPGSGKTSLGLMIGRRFVRDADGLVFYIPNSGFLSAAVEVVRSVEPGRSSMFLMEEADSFLNDTHALSILDGELSLAGAVFVAMTNYKEKMPPRIANRPGRFDRVLYIGAPPRAVQIEYFKRLVARLDEPAAKDAPVILADALEGLAVSMAHLREAFIAHVLMGVSPAEVRRRFDEMAKDGAGEDSSSDEKETTCYSCAGPLDGHGECVNTTCPECDDYDGSGAE